jgi:hypothetical protein
MATTIVTKNSATAGSAPSAGALSQGELAVNVADKRLYTKDSGGSVVEVGTNPGGAVTFTAGSASAPAITTTGDTNTGIFFPAADTIAFAEGGAEAMRLDSSGNLGLGVTPSVWNSDYRALDVSPYGNFYGRVATSNTGVVLNGYRNAGGSWIYKNTSAAARYEQDSGFHIWYNAPSGTAGNAITFTQAMTLDASGNFQLGSTTARDRLFVYGSGSQYVRVGSSTNTSFRGYAIGAADANATQYATLAMNIDSGELRLTAGDSGYGGYQTFYAAGSEVMRLVGGNLLVGRTTALGGISFQNASETSMYRPTTNASQSITSFWSDVGGTQTVRAYIKVDGGLANYSANDVNLSDAREKTNFAPSEDYLEKICAIPVQTFNYINEETDGKTLGVVAQDVQAVAPELITESNWGTEEEPKMRLSIYQTDLQYALMKAIQELKAEVDSLKAQLENK